MSDRWKEICPVCGNYRQNGTCLRCNANAASRARRWRRGDRGGVRPERRNFVSGSPGKKASRPEVRSTKKCAKISQGI